MAGIYIHIPFCSRACTYCNFHFSTSLAQKDDLLHALDQEIILCEPFSENEKIDTVYFGGGTPSILSKDELSNILKRLNKKFLIDKQAEITIEVNPENISPVSLNDWKKLGFNRLSAGIQSFNDEELKWMNRLHNAETSVRCIDEIIAGGYSNFSVDLIYGSPFLSVEDLIKSLDIIVDKNIPHISCYALTVEPKTALDAMIRQKKTQPVNNEKQSSQFLTIMKYLRNAGYEHYEISNFAKPGMRSKHNSSYWKGRPYYGFGPSAHSFNGENVRRWNIANNALYIRSLQETKIPFTEEVLTTSQQLNEQIMISLRTSEGLDLGKLEKKYNTRTKEQILKECSIHFANGRLQLTDDFLRLTDEGKLFADGIAGSLFF